MTLGPVATAMDSAAMARVEVQAAAELAWAETDFLAWNSR